MDKSLVKISSEIKERLIKFIALGPNNLIVGYFTLNKNKVWSFVYAENFKQSVFSPLEEFPLLDKTYGHESCVRFLSERLKNNQSLSNGVSDISCLNNDDRGRPVEIHALN